MEMAVAAMSSATYLIYPMRAGLRYRSYARINIFVEEFLVQADTCRARSYNHIFSGSIAK